MSALTTLMFPFLLALVVADPMANFDFGPTPQPGKCTCIPPLVFSTTRRMKILPFGFPPLMPTLAVDAFGVCDTNGKQYFDKCALINAQSSDPTLGGRPCNMAAVVSAYGNMTWPASSMTADVSNALSGMSATNVLNAVATVMNGSLSPDMGAVNMVSDVMRKMANMYKVCLTNNQTVSNPMDLMQQLQGSPTLGIRCCGQCPCSLECPSKKEVIMQMMDDMTWSMRQMIKDTMMKGMVQGMMQGMMQAPTDLTSTTMGSR